MGALIQDLDVEVNWDQNWELPEVLEQWDEEKYIHYKLVYDKYNLKERLKCSGTKAKLIGKQL